MNDEGEINKKKESNSQNCYVVSMNIEDNGAKRLSLTLFDRNFTDIQTLLGVAVSCSSIGSGKPKTVGQLNVEGGKAIEIGTAPLTSANLKIRWGYGDKNERANSSYVGFSNWTKEQIDSGKSDDEDRNWRWRDLQRNEKMMSKTKEVISDDVNFSDRRQQSTIRSSETDFIIIGLSSTLTETGVRYDIKAISNETYALDGLKFVQRYAVISGRPTSVFYSLQNAFNNSKVLRIEWDDLSNEPSTLDGFVMAYNYETGEYESLDYDQVQAKIEEAKKPIEGFKLYILGMKNLLSCITEDGQLSNYLPNPLKIEKKEVSKKLKDAGQSVKLSGGTQMAAFAKAYRVVSPVSTIATLSDLGKLSDLLLEVSYSYQSTKEYADKNNYPDKEITLSAEEYTTLLLGILGIFAFDKKLPDKPRFTFSKNTSEINTTKKFLKNKFKVFEAFEELNKALPWQWADYINKNDPVEDYEIADLALYADSDPDTEYSNWKRWYEKVIQEKYPDTYNNVNIYYATECKKMHLGLFHNPDRYLFGTRGMVANNSAAPNALPEDEFYDDMINKSLLSVVNIQQVCDGDYISVLRDSGKAKETLLALNNLKSYLSGNYLSKWSILNYKEWYDGGTKTWEIDWKKCHNVCIDQINAEEEFSFENLLKKGGRDILSTNNNLHSSYSITCSNSSINVEEFLRRYFIDLANDPFLKYISSLGDNDFDRDSGGPTVNNIETIASSYEGTEAYLVIGVDTKSRNSVRIGIFTDLKNISSDKCLSFGKNGVKFDDVYKEFQTYNDSNNSEACNVAKSLSIACYPHIGNRDTTIIFNNFTSNGKSEEVGENLEIKNDSTSSGDTSSGDTESKGSFSYRWYKIKSGNSVKIILYNESKPEYKEEDAKDKYKELMRCIREESTKCAGTFRNLPGKSEISTFENDICDSIKNNEEDANVTQLIAKVAKQKRSVEADLQGYNAENDFFSYIYDKEYKKGSFNNITSKIREMDIGYKEVFSKGTNNKTYIESLLNILTIKKEGEERNALLDQWVGNVSSRISSLQKALNERYKTLERYQELDVGQEIELHLGNEFARQTVDKEGNIKENKKTWKNVSSLFNEFCNLVPPLISNEERTMLLESKNDEDNSVNATVYNDQGEETQVNLLEDFPRQGLTWSIIRMEGDMPVVGFRWKRPITPNLIRMYNWGVGNAKQHCIKSLSLASGSEFAMLHRNAVASTNDDGGVALKNSYSEGATPEYKTCIEDNPIFVNEVVTNNQGKNVLNNMRSAISKGTVTLIGDPSIKFHGKFGPYSYPIYLNIVLPNRNKTTLNSLLELKSGESPNAQQYQLSGYYVIKKITHDISTSGYTTTLEIMRFPGSSGSVK